MELPVISKRQLNILMAQNVDTFLKIPFAPSAAAFPNLLALYLKGLKLLTLAISASKSVSSSFE